MPTSDEILNETFYQGVANAQDAFNTFLKLPTAGARSIFDGHIYSQGEYSCLWSSDSSSYNNRYSSQPYFNASIFQWQSAWRTGGCLIRCIKE